MSDITRKIELPEDPEGVMYDYERAQREGLYENVRGDLFEMAHDREMSVNMPPGIPTESDGITYVYGYGPNCEGDAA